MKKAIILVLCLMCFASLTGCADTADNGDTTKNGVIGDGLKDDANDVKNDIQNGANDVKNSVENGVNDLKDDVTNDNSDSVNLPGGGGTTTTDNGSTMNNGSTTNNGSTNGSVNR